MGHFRERPTNSGSRAGGHVVGHDIKDLANSQFLQARAESPVTFFAAEFLIHLFVVDDVIAVHAARRGLEIG